MFGYVVINRQELKVRELETYQAYYCGLCRTLQERYGHLGQLSLTYDMTFLAILLTGLYEPKEETKRLSCLLHPFTRRQYKDNPYLAYAADMNVLLGYLKCMDDWKDERKHMRALYAALLRGRTRRAAVRYKKKTAAIVRSMRQLSEAEARNEQNLDFLAGCFGDLLAEVFAVSADLWENDLRRMGYFLGKWIYLLDAYVDLEEDRKKQRFNPLAGCAEMEGFEEWMRQLLLLTAAETARAFERLPILHNVGILRNILYSGIWMQYRRKKTASKEDV